MWVLARMLSEEFDTGSGQRKCLERAAYGPPFFVCPARGTQKNQRERWSENAWLLRLAFELFQLTCFAIPLFCIGQRVFFLGNIRPYIG